MKMIVSLPAVEMISASLTVQPVVIQTAIQPIVARPQPFQCRGITSQILGRHVADQRVASGRTVQNIVAQSALDEVIPGFTVQPVGSRTTIDHVVTGLSEYPVIADSSEDLISLRAALNPVVTHSPLNPCRLDQIGVHSDHVRTGSALNVNSFDVLVGIDDPLVVHSDRQTVKYNERLDLVRLSSSLDL
jgi:hypothetical protein